MIKDIEEETKKAEAYLEEVKGEYYYDGDLGLHLDTACWNVKHLLSLVKKYREDLKYSTIYLEELTQYSHAESLQKDALKRIRLNHEALKEE